MPNHLISTNHTKFPLIITSFDKVFIFNLGKCIFLTNVLNQICRCNFSDQYNITLHQSIMKYMFCDPSMICTARRTYFRFFNNLPSNRTPKTEPAVWKQFLIFHRSSSSFSGTVTSKISPTLTFIKRVEIKIVS